MSVAKSSFLFTLGTLLSRISGLLRDMVVVAVFGASSLLDAFIVAFRIPNLLREMLAEGALASAFTKVYTQLKEEDTAKADRLLYDSIWLFSAIAVIVCGLGILFSTELVELMSLAAKDREDFIRNASGLTRILFPYLGIMMVSSIIMGALHQKGRFFLSAFAPVGFNFGYIFGAYFLSSWFAHKNFSWVEQYIAEPKTVGLAIGVLLGGCFQLFMQAHGMWAMLLKKLPRAFGLSIWNENTKKVVWLMLPAAIAASSGPINVFINTNFATSLGAGAVSWLNFSFRILQLPIGLFAVAIGIAVLPTITRTLSASKGRVDEKVSFELQQALELVVWLMSFCSLFILFNSFEIISLIFKQGAFTLHDTGATSQALFAYSFGMLGYGLIKVLTSFFYAVEQTSYAMRVSLVSIAVNFIGNYLLVHRFGHVGLAMTSSISLSLNAILLGIGCVNRGFKIDRKRLTLQLVYITIGISAGLALMYVLDQIFETLFHYLPEKLCFFIELSLQALSLGALFLWFALRFYNLTWSELIRLVHSKLRRRRAS